MLLLVPDKVYVDDPVLTSCCCVAVVGWLQAVTSHPGGLGSGWRMVILALRLGAADGSPPVMAQTQEALQVRTCLPPGNS
jgi:hypothetical protein